jgi:hypothetical protein
MAPCRFDPPSTPVRDKGFPRYVAGASTTWVRQTPSPSADHQRPTVAPHAAASTAGHYIASQAAFPVTAPDASSLRVGGHAVP